MTATTTVKKINVYTTSHRVRARQELKRHGIKPYTPPEFGGLIAANDRPREALYVHQCIGKASRQEFARMYGRSSRTQRVHKYKTGEILGHRKGREEHRTLVPCKVTEVYGDGWYEIEFAMMRKRFRAKVREADLVKDPQIKYEPG